MQRSLRVRVGTLWCLFAAAGGAAFAACSGGADPPADGPPVEPAAGTGGGGSGGASAAGGGHRATGGAGGSSAAGAGGAGIHALGGAAGKGGGAVGLDVEPAALQTLVLKPGQPVPTLSYQATLDGQPVTVGWSVDRGEIGFLASVTGTSDTFTPRGTTAGTATIRGGLNGQTVARQVLVQIQAAQNGPGPKDNPAGQPTAGGLGGVGGEGVGAPVSDPATKAALGSPTDPKPVSLTLIYPYDRTVWPRGMLPPLLQWSSSLGDADAVSIQLSTKDGAYSYTGMFSRPAALAPGAPFIHHPIPIDAWTSATNSASGPNQLVVSLVVARGGKAYGPVTETWTVAPGRLSGTVYYNSYGTQFVKNWVNLDAAKHSVGAAILAVRSGDAAPTLVVGQNSPVDGQGNPSDDSGCRVCHIVSSGGKRLLAQAEHGDPGDGTSWMYDLTLPPAMVQASAVQLTPDGVFGWAAMTSDGSRAFTNVLDPSSSNMAISGSTSALYALGGPSPAMLPASGLPAGLGAGYPSFSQDNRLLAYQDATGMGQTAGGPIKVLSFDPASNAFSAENTVASPMAGQRTGYPSFLPTNQGLVFETEVRPSQQDQVMVTRNGARSELWWAPVNGGSAAPLALLNGKAGGTSYLPSGPSGHGQPGGATSPQSGYDETGLDDSQLNYEPTVNPVVSGGYAWVVFTSRRLYGNVLTAPPWRSWPPDYDTQSLADATTKKLWVAAVEVGSSSGGEVMMGIPPGSDPSHPAFYLPGQELLAGNSRGFWVLDPCRPDGTTCDTGDECCNGYCQPSGSDPSKLVCSNKTTTITCSQPQEKCATAADCCDKSDSCINGFCALPTPIPK